MPRSSQGIVDPGPEAFETLERCRQMSREACGKVRTTARGQCQEGIEQCRDSRVTMRDREPEGQRRPDLAQTALRWTVLVREALEDRGVLGIQHRRESCIRCAGTTQVLPCRRGVGWHHGHDGLKCRAYWKAAQETLVDPRHVEAYGLIAHFDVAWLDAPGTADS